MPTTSRPWQTQYAPGVPGDIEVTDESLSDLLDSAVRRFPEHVALDFYGATTTYRELGDQVARAAQALADQGVRRGDRVALVIPNCPQHVVAFYAALRLGAVVVEHNPLYTAEELHHQFADHGATVAIAWDKVVPTLQQVGLDTELRTVIAVDLTTALPTKQRWMLQAAGGQGPAHARGDDRARRPGPCAGSSWSVAGGRCRRRTRGPRPTTSRCCSTPAARPACPRARCSATATCGRTRRRAARGCRASPTARRSSTPCCRSSTPTGSRCASPSR